MHCVFIFRNNGHCVATEPRTETSQFYFSSLITELTFSLSISETMGKNHQKIPLETFGLTFDTPILIMHNSSIIVAS